MSLSFYCHDSFLSDCPPSHTHSLTHNLYTHTHQIGCWCWTTAKSRNSILQRYEWILREKRSQRGGAGPNIQFFMLVWIISFLFGLLMFVLLSFAFAFAFAFAFRTCCATKKVRSSPWSRKRADKTPTCCAQLPCKKNNRFTSFCQFVQMFV
jgi:hypothetical protein